jgi:HD-GYP domain-containing protein (c-di-GMP phosphodiesterase class II)
VCAEAARHLELSERDRTTLRLAASLCQIGKIFIPAEILAKPGRHTAEETRIMQGHVDHALRVLREIDFELPVAETIHQMYERLDGTGYPRGLQGCDLPIETRILAVCDVYDALVSDRVYRAAWTPERAFALLHEDSGTGYDPAVVKALERVVCPADGAASWVAGLAAASRRPVSGRAAVKRT